MYNLVRDRGPVFSARQYLFDTTVVRSWEFFLFIYLFYCVDTVQTNVREQ